MVLVLKAPDWLGHRLGLHILGDPSPRWLFTSCCIDNLLHQTALSTMPTIVIVTVPERLLITGVEM